MTLGVDKESEAESACRLPWSIEMQLSCTGLLFRDQSSFARPQSVVTSSNVIDLSVGEYTHLVRTYHHYRPPYKVK